MSTRPHKIQVRMSAAEVAHLDQRAQTAGMTRSAYARAVLGGTSLGDHFVGKVETATPGKGQTQTWVANPVRSGIAVVIRPEDMGPEMTTKSVRRRALRAVPEQGGTPGGPS